MKKGCGLGQPYVAAQYLGVHRQPTDLSVGGHPKKRAYDFSRGFQLDFLPLPSGRGKKKEAALPQHYLSPNQIKPNYIFRKTSSSR